MRRLLTSIFILSACLLKAQQEPQNAFYFFNPVQYNPAYAGSTDNLTINSITRAQWLGWDGAPKTQFLTLHLPVARQRIGLGATMTIDRIGTRTAFNAMAQFAYHIKLDNKNTKLALGVSGGFQQDAYNFTSLMALDPSDQNYLLSNSVVNPNFGFGAYLYAPKYYVGLSIPRLLKQSIDNSTGHAFDQPHIYLMSGYVFPINSVIDLRPSLFLKYTSNAPITTDFNLSAFFYKQVWFGAMWRYNSSYGLNCSFQATPAFQFGYAFEYPYNSMYVNQWGNHEVMLTYRFQTNKNAFYSPRYF